MDRLSRLPEDVQSTIMHRLSLKDLTKAAFTCRNWCRICFSQLLMDMEFREELFVEREQPMEMKSVQRDNFLRLVRTWLHLYQPPRVQNLSISLSEMPNTQHAFATFTDSINFARAKQVESYSWYSSNPSSRGGGAIVVMPRLRLHLLNYAELDTLKLVSCILDVDNLSTFSSLRNLFLGRLELRQSVLGRLLAECPSLENLSMKRCWNLDFEQISGGQLRSLTIEECHFHPNALDLVLYAPKLRCFHYSGDFRTTENLHKENMEELYLEYGFETDFNMYADYLFELIQDHSHIRVLTVDSYIFQLLPFSQAAGFSPPLELRCLKWITRMHEYEFFGFSFFLKDCPRVETLIIQIKRVHVLEGFVPPQELLADYWDGDEMIVPPCLQRSLKLVEVEGFKGTLNEIKFLTYIIKYGLVMQKITLKFPKGKTVEENDGYATRAQLLSRTNVPRVSPELRIFTERDP